MSTQESTRDAPQDTVQNFVDSFPPLRTPLDPSHTNFEEAIKVHGENIDITSSTYSMTHPNRGIALIINNEKFLPQKNVILPKRDGSAHDVKRLKEVLIKLKFNVTIRENKTVKEMKQIFEDISQTNHTQNDCFLCVILSHGKDENLIYGTDDTVDLKDLISYTLPNKCSSLVGKPKLFFIQACRGTKSDEGVEMKDAWGSSHAGPSVQKIPLWADILISYSSVPGYYSFKNSAHGSWFIQSVCHILEKYGNDLEIQQIMIKVNARVAFEYESKSHYPGYHQKKQVPQVTSMLTKELKFSSK